MRPAHTSSVFFRTVQTDTRTRTAQTDTLTAAAHSRI